MKANRKLGALASLLALFGASQLGAQSLKAVDAEYYGEIGCSHCDLFMEKTLPAAEIRTGVSVNLEAYDILSTDGYERCKKRLADFGMEFTIFPVLVIGNNAYQGNSAVEGNLEPELAHYAKEGFFRPRIISEAHACGSPKLDLSFVPLFGAGLVDGINPCAFATLLFFISFFSLRGGSRRQIAGIGLLFAAGVFLSYLLIGLGLLNVIRAGLRMTALRLTLRIFVSVATAAFCVFTIRDLFRMRRGKPSDMRLQLSLSIKRRIHSSIRAGSRSAALPLGVFVSGLVVSVLELACTGQVYFPALSFMAQTDLSWMGIGSLLLYNLAFITPLLIVLAMILFGASRESIRQFFERHIFFAKAALAVTFAALAVLVWLS